MITFMDLAVHTFPSHSSQRIILKSSLSSELHPACHSSQILQMFVSITATFPKFQGTSSSTSRQHTFIRDSDALMIFESSGPYTNGTKETLQDFTTTMALLKKLLYVFSFSVAQQLFTYSDRP